MLFRFFILIFLFKSLPSEAAEDLKQALRRAQYLLNGTITNDIQYASHALSRLSYETSIRGFINHNNYYDILLRYHQRTFGVGLPIDYIEELVRDDLDNKQNKFATITCERTTGFNSRFRCFWSSNRRNNKSGGCPVSWEEAASVFWYPGIVAWVCPSIVRTCGQNLSGCFIRYSNENEARNSELGATETFDSRFAVINSLSKQSAGLATAVVLNNLPYTSIVDSSLFAIDGAIAHFYRQPHHFKIDQLNIHPELLSAVQKISLTDTRFRLFQSTTSNYANAGVLTTFGWLRRYDKHRTRANQLYERLLCKKFTAELPAVFPQDPGNLRVTPGCSGCHARLDPLADFFAAWGEGGDLYLGGSNLIETSFLGDTSKPGASLYDLAKYIQQDAAFATCQVQHVWGWLMGRSFYDDEATLRQKFTEYFIATRYSFNELVFAIATHPAFLDGKRSDADVESPLEEPPLGRVPSAEDLPCEQDSYSYSSDVQPNINSCTGCHYTGSNLTDLSNESGWIKSGSTAVSLMNLGNMPPGAGAGSSEILAFKEKVRCWLKNL